MREIIIITDKSAMSKKNAYGRQMVAFIGVMCVAQLTIRQKIGLILLKIYRKN